MRSWIFALMLVLMPAFSYAQDTPQLEQLARIRLHIETVQQLQQEGGLTQQQASAQKTKYLQEAAKIVNRETLTEEQLTALTGDVKLEAPGTLARLAGYITLVNITMVTAAILLAIAISWLCYLYIYPLVKELSDVAIEFGAYTSTACLIGSSQGLPEVAVVPTAFIGCLLLLGCLSLTEKYHFSQIGNWKNTSTRFVVYNSLLFLVWGAAAVFFQSSLIGFIAVGAAVTALGFSVLVTPLCYCIGFEDNDAVVRGTSAAGIAVVIYTLIKTSGIAVSSDVEVFRTGVMFIGTFVYFIGLLILSSKWYSGFEGKISIHWFMMQLLMIASGIAAISVGSIFEVGTLQKIGGTLFYLYAIEKYFEIPWGKTSWAWVTLFFAGLLYLGSLFASANPTYFIF